MLHRYLLFEIQIQKNKHKLTFCSHFMLLAGTVKPAAPQNISGANHFFTLTPRRYPV